MNKIKILALLAFTIALNIFLGAKSVGASEEGETEQYVIIDAKTGKKEEIDLSNSIYDVQSFQTNSSLLAGKTVLPNNSIGTWSILGEDNRQPVADSSIMPYRAIARLDITLQDGRKTYGSGALIANKLFATAGHVIVEDGELPKAVTLEFGRNGSSVYYTTSDIKSYILRADYKTNPTYEGDYAFIVLNNGLGGRTGFFGIESSISVGTTIFTAGYPQDKGGRNMYMSQGEIKKVETDRVHYDADTIGGQSGSPVYIKKNGRLYIVAIHTNGTYTPNEAGATNSGRRMNASLCAWLQDNGYLN